MSDVAGPSGQVRAIPEGRAIAFLLRRKSPWYGYWDCEFSVRINDFLEIVVSDSTYFGLEVEPGWLLVAPTNFVCSNGSNWTPKLATVPERYDLKAGDRQFIKLMTTGYCGLVGCGFHRFIARMIYPPDEELYEGGELTQWSRPVPADSVAASMKGLHLLSMEATPELARKSGVVGFDGAILRLCDHNTRLCAEGEGVSPPAPPARQQE